MQPTELIEFMVVGTVIGVIIIVSFVLKGNWRKLVVILSIVFLLAYSAFFIVRPYWIEAENEKIDAKIEKKVEMLEPYLEQKYPNEEWTITTVPHRKDGYKHLNPYYIGVVFEDDPKVTYHYWVEENNIYQISFSTKKEYSGDFKYEE